MEEELYLVSKERNPELTQEQRNEHNKSVRKGMLDDYMKGCQQLLAHNISKLCLGVFIPNVCLGRSFSNRAILETCA